MSSSNMKVRPRFIQSAYHCTACEAQHLPTLGLPFCSCLNCLQSICLAPVLHFIHCHPLKSLIAPGITTNNTMATAFVTPLHSQDKPPPILMICQFMQSCPYCVLWLITLFMTTFALHYTIHLHISCSRTAQLWLPAPTLPKPMTGASPQPIQPANSIMPT